MDNNQLLKGKDVARILNISIALAYRLISNGEIVSVRFGRTVRVRQDDLENWIKKNMTCHYEGRKYGEAENILNSRKEKEQN